MADKERWDGTATDLLRLLTPEKPPRGWPCTAHHLSGRLKRAQEPLFRVGVVVGFDQAKTKDRTRKIVLEAKGEHEQASAASAASTGADSKPRTGGSGADADADAQCPPQRPHDGADSKPTERAADAADAADAGLRTALTDTACTRCGGPKGRARA